MNDETDLSNIMSFGSGCSGQSFTSYSTSTRQEYSQPLGAKVEMVYSLLSMLGTTNRNDMSKTLLAMASSPESCLAMRQSGCLPLLIQLIHSPGLDINVRRRATEALNNIVHTQTDEKKRRREARVLKLLQHIREYCDELRIQGKDKDCTNSGVPEKHPLQTIEALMKYSFDAEHRQAMCNLGGLHAIAELIQLDHEVHGSMSDNILCITLRRYAGMSLTNLIFGDGNNKALLCGFNKFMRALVSQLMGPSEDLRQVTAGVLRNLSWRADAESKQALRDIGAVTALMVAAMEGKNESTLKSILSALWNLSAHCSMNKVDMCAVPGAVAFLVKMLKYKAASNTLAVVENAGGILRNISSHIAVREDYRQILRENNCFEILLEQLKSPSLTIVSNACGTLWNLSARCSEDQRRLWEMGAISMLRSLIQSKHKMISMGSSAALKNLLTANSGRNLSNLEPTAKNFDISVSTLGVLNLPNLYVRKQRILEQQLDIPLRETCEDDLSDLSTSSKKHVLETEERKRFLSKKTDYHSNAPHSGSRHRKLNQLLVVGENKLGNKDTTAYGNVSEDGSGQNAVEVKLSRRFKSLFPTPTVKKLNQERNNEKVRGIADAFYKGGRRSQNALEKRGIPALKNRIKNKNGSEERHCDQYFSRNNFSSQYEDERPVNYSLKYSETEGFGGKASNDFADSSKKDLKSKENFPEYPNYAETDLDQPTDFSLKYGEETSSDEESKRDGFNYFEEEKRKEPEYFGGQPECDDTTRTYYTEGTPYEGTPFNYSSSNSMSDLRVGHTDVKENTSVSSGPQPEKGETLKLTFRIAQEYKSADESPLMFSRNSSLNSLSSFEEIHETILDDRSSILSDFSPMTSGLISPSELPDSPTQTIPPSPKEPNTSDCFLPKGCLQKPVSFENEAFSYKNDGAKKIFSGTTNSLNTDNSLKRHFHFKTNSSSSSAVSFDEPKFKEEIHHNSPVKNHCDDLKEEKVPEENGEVEKMEVCFKNQMNQSMSSICVDNVLQEKTHRSVSNQFCEKTCLDTCLPNTNPQCSDSEKKLVAKRNNQTNHQRDANKIFSACGESDDMVHTYYTEGTPANVSHSGSHSDLSNLSMITSGLLTPTTSEEKGNNYWHGKENQSAKDKSSTFATENSSCNSSLRSSLNDLSANLEESPTCFSRPEENGNEPSNVLASHSPANSSGFPESEDVDQGTEEKTIIFDAPEKIEGYFKYFGVAQSENDGDSLLSLSAVNKFAMNANIIKPQRESQSPLNLENAYTLELTPLEQVLLEQCIISGMPHKSHSKKFDGKSIQSLQSYDENKLSETEENDLEENVVDLDIERKTNSPNGVNESSRTAEAFGLEVCNEYSRRNVSCQSSIEEDSIFDGGPQMHNFSMLTSLNSLAVNSKDSAVCLSSQRVKLNQAANYSGNSNHDSCSSKQNFIQTKLTKKVCTAASKKCNQNKFQNEANKIFSTCAESDDVVHTYCTEGTPANVSHAGSHSDLSNLSIITGELLSPTALEEPADDSYQYSADTEKILAECILSGMPKGKYIKKNHPPDAANARRRNGATNKMNRVGISLMNLDVCAKNEVCNEFLPKKDNQLPAKDEISMFATENSPCNFSLRSSLSDLTVNSLDSSGCLSRAEMNKFEKPKNSPLSNTVNEQSSNVVCFIRAEEEGQISNESRRMAFKYCEKETSIKETQDPSLSPPHKREFFDRSETSLVRNESYNSLNGENFDSSETSALEQALLEQCIISGMPSKPLSRTLEVQNFRLSYENKHRLEENDDRKSNSGKKADLPKTINQSSHAADDDTNLYLFLKVANCKDN